MGCLRVLGWYLVILRTSIWRSRVYISSLVMVCRSWRSLCFRHRFRMWDCCLRMCVIILSLQLLWIVQPFRFCSTLTSCRLRWMISKSNNRVQSSQFSLRTQNSQRISSLGCSSKSSQSNFCRPWTSCNKMTFKRINSWSLRHLSWVASKTCKIWSKTQNNWQKQLIKWNYSSKSSKTKIKSKNVRNYSRKSSVMSKKCAFK